MIPFEQVGGDHLRIVARHGRKWRPDQRGIPCRVDRGIRDALKVLVQLDPTVLDRDFGGGQIELIECGPAPRRMDDEIGLEGLLACVGRCLDPEDVTSPMDRRDGRPSAHIDTHSIECLHEPADEIRVELREHPLAPLKHRNLCPGSRRDARELGRDVAAADEDNPRR